jgi:hypothetical protein
VPAGWACFSGHIARPRSASLLLAPCLLPLLRLPPPGRTTAVYHGLHGMRAGHCFAVASGW